MLQKTIEKITRDELTKKTATNRVIKKYVVVSDVAAINMKGGKADFEFVGTDYGTSGLQTAEKAARQYFKEHGISGKPFAQKRKTIICVDLEKAIENGCVYELDDIGEIDADDMNE